MLKLTPIKTTDSVYPFVEQLLHDSFPLAERRDDEAQRVITQIIIRALLVISFQMMNFRWV